MSATAVVLLSAAITLGVISGVVIAVEMRRLGDLAEAVNNAIERVAVELKRKK